MDIRDFARRLPKAELHNHLHGTLTDETLRKVAAANDVAVPDGFMDIPERYEDLADFLSILSLICRAVQTADDFHLVTYEMLKDTAANGCRYIEFFVSPHAHMQHGARYTDILDGMTRAMADAEQDHGIVSRVIPAHNRQLGLAEAMAFIEYVAAHRRDEVIGVGLDFNEAPHPPHDYVPMYEVARKAGLKTTAHAGEDGPPEFVRAALDDLGCMRIDHGYSIIEDAALTERCRASGMMFTACPTTTLSTTKWTDLSDPGHAIRLMKEAGLTLSINTDDSTLFGTDLTNEYAILAEQAGFTPADLAKCAQDALRHSWLDDSTKAAWLKDWQAETNALMKDVEAVA